MKYFIDTEFIEGFHKPMFGRKRHFIDLISIGIFCEDGRKYYAISNEYKYNDADKWVQENVILQIYKDFIHGDQRNKWEAGNFHFFAGKSNKQISIDIVDFINPPIQDLVDVYTRHGARSEEFYPKEFAYIKAHNTKIPDTYWKSGGVGYVKNRALIYNQPEFYAYYADYDWVLFCSLFGRMIDLPKGFPMYCIDLKQTLDEKAAAINQLAYTKMLVSGTNWEVKGEMSREVMDIDEYSLDQKIALLKTQPDYPKQANEHNAIADAKWNYELYKFLTK